MKNKYTNYSKNNNQEIKHEVTTESNEEIKHETIPGVETEMEIEAETEVETEMETEAETEVETEAETETDPQIEEIYSLGVVNTTRLNVRKEPDKNSEVLLIINKDTEVKIIGDENYNDNFYKVNIDTNMLSSQELSTVNTNMSSSMEIEGYCMREFINIK